MFMVSVNIACLHITYVPHSNNEPCIYRIHRVHAISQEIYDYTHIAYNSCVFSTNVTSSCFYKQPKFMFGLEQPDGRNADIPWSSATKCQLEECARRDDHDGCLPSVSGCVLRHILIFTKIDVSVYRNLSNEPKQQVMSRNIWLSRLGGFASLPL